MGRKKTGMPAVQKSATARSHVDLILDEMLPLAEPGQDEIHLNAAILETSDPAQLLELAADGAIRPLLLCRLSPNVALVDPNRAGELAEVLLRRGHTPKIVKS
jgi:hypothetical protein